MTTTSGFSSTPGRERTAVERVVWPWNRRTGLAAPRAPWRRALTQVALMTAAAAVLHLYFHKALAASILLGVAAVVLTLAAVAPPAFRQLEKAMEWLVAGFGKLLNHVLLVPFFYLVFVPGRLFMTMSGKDPLERKYPAPEHKTFWVKHAGPADAAAYQRQH